MDFLTNGKVAIAISDCYKYPKKENAFRPDTAYPEYIFGKENVSNETNDVYAAVRESLHLLGLDEDNYGTEDWNPFKEFIKPGYNVLVKPNLVMDLNPSGEGTDCLYTQPSVVAPVVDYILIALEGHGKIVIGDAPMQECKFDKLVDESGYKLLVEWYNQKGYDVELVDFRELKSDAVNGIRVQHISDSARGTVIDLGSDSEFYGESKESLDKMRITNYDPDILKQHHTIKKNEYYVSDYLLNADCVINMPKPKTHRKAGVTISLKNMVGINVRKEYLPHHTIGSTEEGGDEYDRKNVIHRLRSKFWDKRNKMSAKNKFMEARIYHFFSRMCSAILKMNGSYYSEGSWWGNHTISRTIADLNKILYYADKDGNMQLAPQRQVLIIADMIVSGEKEGPISPSAKNVGIIASGINPVCFDEAIVNLMGFDILQVPTLKTARNIKGKYKLVDKNTIVHYCSNSGQYGSYSALELPQSAKLNYIPTKGWMGHI